MRANWLRSVFDSVNGTPSAKRFNGTIIVVTGILLGFVTVVLHYLCIMEAMKKPTPVVHLFLIPETLIIGWLTAGIGLLASTLGEKKHVEPKNEPNA